MFKMPMKKKIKNYKAVEQKFDLIVLI